MNTTTHTTSPQVGDLVLYTGKSQSSSVGETLEPGDVVKVRFIRDTFGMRSYGVDKASDAFGTGRTYTVWTAWSGQLSDEHDPSGRACALAGRAADGHDAPGYCPLCFATISAEGR